MNILLFYFKLTFKSVMYLPVSAMKNLVPVYTPFPMANAGLAQMAEGYEKEFGIPYYLPQPDAIIVSIFFIVVFIALSYWRFSKSDL